MPLRQSATRYKQKNRNVSCYQTINFFKIRFLFLVSSKGQKSDKSHYFYIKMSLTFLVKSLQCVFTDSLRHKTLNKLTCRTPLANSCQLCAYLSKIFSAVMIIFWGFLDFLTCLAKYF